MIDLVLKAQHKRTQSGVTIGYKYTSTRPGEEKKGLPTTRTITCDQRYNFETRLR